MVLIKQNKEKQRCVYKLSDRYRKEWTYKDELWLSAHVDLLNKIKPNFVLAHGVKDNSMFIETKIVPGVAASTLDHTPEFIKRIYMFCINNINQTAPYAHGDWVLSNIVVDGDNIEMIDWDNLNLYPKTIAYNKLHNDLKSAFGDKFDPTSL